MKIKTKFSTPMYQIELSQEELVTLYDLVQAEYQDLFEGLNDPASSPKLKFLGGFMDSIDAALLRFSDED